MSIRYQSYDHNEITNHLESKLNELEISGAQILSVSGSIVDTNKKQINKASHKEGNFVVIYKESKGKN